MLTDYLLVGYLTFSNIEPKIEPNRRRDFFAFRQFGGRRGDMPRYDIYVFCDECHEEHPMGMVFRLDDGPAMRRSIGETYEGKSLPPQILAIEAHKTLCPKTGRSFTQKDHHQIFLVPS